MTYRKDVFQTMVDIRLYLALLTVYESNCRTLHWCLRSKNGWHTGHERFATYYEQLGEYMDQTAEQILTIGGRPVNDAEALKLVEESQIDAFLLGTDQDYDMYTANMAAYRMFKQLHEMAMELEDSDDLPDDVADVFMDHARWYRIEGLYKLGRATEDAKQEEPPVPPAETPAPIVEETEEPEEEEDEED